MDITHYSNADWIVAWDSERQEGIRQLATATLCKER